MADPVKIGSVSGKHAWPIRIGCISSSDQFSKLSMMAMRRLSSKDYYFVSMETIRSGVPRTMQVSVFANSLKSLYCIYVMTWIDL